MVKQNETLQNMMDADLMKLYFGQATACLLKGHLEDARVHARAGLGRYAGERTGDERFGAFVIRAGLVRPVIHPARDFHE